MKRKKNNPVFLINTKNISVHRFNNIFILPTTCNTKFTTVWQNKIIFNLKEETFRYKISQINANIHYIHVSCYIIPKLH